MKLIVGLGNPGDTYKNSRHNIGFAVVRALSRAHQAALVRDKTVSCLCVKAKIGGHNVVLALPLTFMNLSGQAVAALLDRHNACVKDLLVVSDDLDLDLGRLRLRPSGSSGGHRGLGSVIDALGSREFARLRLGIGRPHPGKAGVDYVLSPFLKKEKVILDESVSRAVSCCEAWVKDGIAKAMEKFNRRA